MAINDTDPEEVRGPRAQTIWVTVAEAAEKSGVDTGTVRQWYRSGRLPTQRSQGDRGSFLVPLDAVVALARGDEEGDAVVADLIDLNASYWSAQTEAAREEATAARNELAAAREALDSSAGELEEMRGELAAARHQLDFLRSQLAETSEDARRLREQLQAAEQERDQRREENASLRRELAEASNDLDRTNDELVDSRSRLAALEGELDKLRAISSATGSITDNAWLALPTNSYRSPVRPQGMAATPAGAALSGLIADTTPDPGAGADHDLAMPTLDDERPPATPTPVPDDVTFEDTPDLAPWEASADLPHPGPPAGQRVKPVFGDHDDDLLPQPDKKGRRRRRSQFPQNLIG